MVNWHNRFWVLKKHFLLKLFNLCAFDSWWWSYKFHWKRTLCFTGNIEVWHSQRHWIYVSIFFSQYKPRVRNKQFNHFAVKEKSIYFQYNTMLSSQKLLNDALVIFSLRVRKILNLRVFDENDQRWKKSVVDKNFEVLCVSQVS